MLVYRGPCTDLLTGFGRVPKLVFGESGGTRPLGPPMAMPLVQRCLTHITVYVLIDDVEVDD